MGRQRRRRGVQFGLRCARQGHAQAQGGADARFAVQADLPAHQLGQPFADRQAQAGAAVAAGGVAVGLVERFEQALLLFGADADAGVGDAQAQQVARGRRRGARC
ncbi:hypothetical protein D3C71_1925990 [compost metagenome]